MRLTLALAVEKVLYRLALLEGGAVPIARAFVELPVSLEELEECADRAADGASLVKNEWGEYLAYEFPELIDQRLTAPSDCPTCGGAAPAAPTEGGVEVRAPLVCGACYREVRLLGGRSDASTLSRLGSFFRGEASSDPLEVARIEHEIVFLAVEAGQPQFTHTALAARSRLPAQRIKERLDRMAARRYLHVGLLPSGDAVAYRLPDGLTYPRLHYQRLLDGPDRPGPRDGGSQAGGLKVKTAAPVEEKKPGLKIVIRDRRRRGS